MERKLLGNDHPDTLESINNFALLLVTKGERKEAESLLREAVLTNTRNGNETESTWTSMANLASLLLEENELEQADTLICKALTGRRSLYDNKHPTIQETIGLLAQLREVQGDEREADHLYREVVEGLHSGSK